MSEIINIKDNPSYIDDRGRISMVLESCQIGSVSIINSEPQKTRANHFHKTDNHVILILEGQIEMYERDINKLDQKPIKYILNKGDIYKTENLVQHTMFFPCYTSFLCLSKLPRDTKNYENDTIRFNYSLKDIFGDHFP